MNKCMLILTMALLALLVGGEAISAPAADSEGTPSRSFLLGESHGVRADIDAKRLLRGLETTRGVNDAEERGLPGLAEGMKVWATKSKLGQRTQAWMQMRKEVNAAKRVELAKKLIAENASFSKMYRRKIKTDDYFKATGADYRYRFGPIDEATYARYPALKTWEKYDEYYGVIQFMKNMNKKP